MLNPPPTDPAIAVCRYELKFACGDTATTRAVVNSWTRSHPAGFRQAHPPRRVNSLYFDSEDWESLGDNLAGLPDRCKLRLRWYGSGTALRDSELQLKWKRGRLGWKTTCPVELAIDLADTTWRDVLKQLRREDLGPIAAHLAHRSRPAVITSYERSYFTSADGLIRLTVDTSFEVYHQTLSGRPNLRRPENLIAPLVVELKAPAHLWSRLAEISRGMPLRPATCSKYARSLSAHRFWLQ